MDTREDDYHTYRELTIDGYYNLRKFIAELCCTASFVELCRYCRYDLA